MNSKKNLFIIDSHGKKTNYQILCTFDSRENNKSYMIYTDFSKDSSQAINVYYCCYKNGNKSRLMPIETKEEISLIDSILSSIEQELNTKFAKPNSL